jgi:dolichol-phosphate mannosyltransferase
LIPDTARRLSEAKRLYEIVVVNDGSSDQTSSFLSSLAPRSPVHELRHASNRGYGAALKTGFLWALSQAGPEDAVITMDADTTHDPVYIAEMIAKLEEGFDMVTASYTLVGGHASGVPLFRRLMSHSLNFLMSLVHPMNGITTYTNGYRVYRLTAMRCVHAKFGEHLIDETGFPGGAEFFLKCGSCGAEPAEIPFDLHYENRGSGSKIRIVQTILRYLKLMSLAYRLR